MQKFVIGFLFDEKRKNVILIQKTKPKWQEGLLNGVGGKVEPGEENIQAMIREFQEETGLLIENWVRFLTLKSNNDSIYPYTIEIYKCFVELNTIYKVTTTTEEQILIVNLNNIQNFDRVLNLDWLISVALDPIVTGGEIFTT